jgi:hypothetical protein
MDKVRDRLWIWGHEAGSHDRDWNTPAPSRMTPAEGAYYMGIPNMIMVRYGPLDEMPAEQYAISFRPLQQVVWSIVGAGAQTGEAERDQVLEMAGRFGNFSGVMMDDFFQLLGSDGEMAVLSQATLDQLQNRLTAGERKLNLWVVLYDYQLVLPVADHLDRCDKIAFWTWESPNLANLEQNFDTMEKMAPHCGKILGLYLWDYGVKAPMPLERMQQQCETGLRWLKEGRIEGMIFLASCICDLDLETVEWTRRWIAEVGDQAL